MNACVKNLLFSRDWYLIIIMYAILYKVYARRPIPGDKTDKKAEDILLSSNLQSIYIVRLVFTFYLPSQIKIKFLYAVISELKIWSDAGVSLLFIIII